mmetsp:Transcript_86128/g.238697  ORF Transcript_86128/g.238697 Transcript_86128/m.238697 type:complete len:268 (-) Transcript_86128:193-996(-)
MEVRERSEGQQALHHTLIGLAQTPARAHDQDVVRRDGAHLLELRAVRGIAHAVGDPARINAVVGQVHVHLLLHVQDRLLRQHHDVPALLAATACTAACAAGCLFLGAHGAASPPLRRFQLREQEQSSIAPAQDQDMIVRNHPAAHLLELSQLPADQVHHQTQNGEIEDEAHHRQNDRNKLDAPRVRGRDPCLRPRVEEKPPANPRALPKSGIVIVVATGQFPKEGTDDDEGETHGKEERPLAFACTKDPIARVPMGAYPPPSPLVNV